MTGGPPNLICCQLVIGVLVVRQQQLTIAVTLVLLRLSTLVEMEQHHQI